MKTIFAVPDKDSIDKAGEIIRNGGLVAIPTETVYGLAANALDPAAVKKIYAAKRRPSDNPLIVHISDMEQWGPLVEGIPDEALTLAKKFWPGPLTIILEKSEAIPGITSGGLDTVAVRMPANEVARAVIKSAGVPLAAPSANASGRPSPTKASYVLEDMDGRIDMIIDGGSCEIGVESTVITLAGGVPRILRPGGVTPEMLADALGSVEIDDAVLHELQKGEIAASPGMKYKHYAPKADVTLVKGDFNRFFSVLKEHENVHPTALCFDEDVAGLAGFSALSFGSESDSLSQAQGLFDALRRLDKLGAKTVYARYPSTEGIGLAVFNRMIRSAAFKVIE